MAADARPFRSILVPLDGSPFAEQALPLARELARATRSKLRLVLVHELPGPPVDVASARLYTSIEVAVRKSERAYLQGVAARLREASPTRVHTALLGGPIGPALATYVEEIGADLIVMSTHGRGPFRRFWLGSVADHLVRTAEVPVLLVRPSEEATGQAPPPVIQEILVPLDGSPLAEAALGPASAVAGALGAGLLLLQVVQPIVLMTDPPLAVPTGYDDRLTTIRRREAQDYLDSLRDKLGAQGLRVSTAAVVGGPLAPTILELAGPDRVGLIAIATHGRGGLRRLALGSVADKLVRGADQPVLVVRPAKARRRGS